jgi:kynurenine 3-monooxygenase
MFYQMSQHFYSNSRNGVVIFGAGPAGCLLACYLIKRGYEVTILESRSDMRNHWNVAGRSINLIMTSRGLNALAGVGLAETILKITVPVYGRTLHSKQSQLTFQRYGPDDSFCNYSVSRGQLNVELLNAAESRGAKVFFEHPLDHFDITNKVAFSYIRVNNQSKLRSFHAKHFFATDGAGSRARQALSHFKQTECNTIPLGASYKELFMPATSTGEYVIDKDSLHIWPRGSHFLMALPNLQGSFTMTLYLPDDGPVSFKSLNSDDKVRKYFEENYPDAAKLMPDYVQQFNRNPIGFLGTLNARPWHHDDTLVLLGDAAHAITPFFGQGCNAAFEGVALLDSLMGKFGKDNVVKAFDDYDKIFKPNGDAIANMAVDNYYEMMNKTADAKFLLAKQVEIKLAKVFPIYCSRYAMVTHTLIPFYQCLKVGQIQEEILNELCKNITTDDQVDMLRAKHLIESKLVPLLKQFNLTEKDYVDKDWRSSAKAKL